MIEVEFAAFVRDRYAALARSAFLLTGDRGHAEDLVQTALVKTHGAWARLAVPAVAESYTRTTMVRLAARAARRRWRGEIPSSDALLDADLPDQDLAVALDVRQVLTRLPWAQRAVLVLRFFDDLSEQDTAAALGCSVGTVKSRTSRGLAAMRESGLLAPEPSEVSNG
jgi:RNA polymerase sigma-70 factor (sigma-E family)